MQPSSLIEWVALIASLATIISVPVNVIQWRTTATLKRQYYSKIFAEYNHMYRIAELADRAKAIYKNLSISEPERLEHLIRHIEQTTGISDSVREEIQAYCEKFLNRPVYRQHPAQPDQTVLKPKGFLRKTWQRIW
jgi:hypothetical protein